jgi:hypothetical protein
VSQGRLPQELRLAGITTVEEANAFLRDRYIGEFQRQVQHRGGSKRHGVPMYQPKRSELDPRGRHSRELHRHSVRGRRRRNLWRSSG